MRVIVKYLKRLLLIPIGFFVISIIQCLYRLFKAAHHQNTLHIILELIGIATSIIGIVLLAGMMKSKKKVV